MTPPSFTRILIWLFLVNSALVTTLNHSLLALQSVRVGDSVTLQCTYQESTSPVSMFYWYKQTLAKRPQLLSSYYKHNTEPRFHDEFKDNPRFSLDDKNSLKISDVHLSDSAMYFCGSSDLVDYYFAEPVTVSVEGSDFNVQTLVRQSESVGVHSGDSMTLNCMVHTWSCDEEHSVYWFKSHKDKPQIGIIYTHGGTNEWCGKKSDTETHTCVYDLPLQSVDHTHDGTYCAVASCGQVLFGSRTRLDLHNTKESFAMVYFLSGALAFTITVIILLTFSVYQLKKRTYQCTAAPTVNNEDAENLHYAALNYENSDRARRPRRQKDDTFTECVYSSVYQSSSEHLT